PESYKGFGEKLLNELIDEEVIIHADESIHSDIKQSELATVEVWYKEYLGNELSIKIVPNYISAIEHINQNGTGHSEDIITKNKVNTHPFIQGVEASSVSLNDSSRFTDASDLEIGSEI